MRIITLILASGAAALATAPAFGHDTNTNTNTNRAFAEVRQATAKYHNVDRALQDGYVRVSDCVEVPGVGAMGYHYLNRALAKDPAIDPRKPEQLLYAPKPGGGLRLVGVEYFKVDADQDSSTDDDRPTVAGIPLEGPMPGHGPGMPVHYDLHVWLWKHNPNGTFAQFNPNVNC